MAELDLSLLVLPGTIPGLLRRGSPVRGKIGEFTDIAGIFLTDDAAHQAAPAVAVAAFPNYGEIMAWPKMEVIGLDLTDATGRYHAALRWRAAQRPRFGHPGDATGDGTLLRMHNPGVTYFSSGGLYAVSHPVKRPSYLARADVVPALADLDPNDDRRLPDGSRWVDAEALRLVCLHVHAVNEASR